MTYPEAQTVASINAALTSRVGPATVAAVLTPGGMPAAATKWTGIRTSPVDLHKQSGLERNLYAMARCLASETGGPGEAYLSIAECLRNEAAKRGCDVYQLLAIRTSTSYAWTQGKYGEQKGRFASTRQDPTQRTVTAARASLAGSNLTSGAVRWYAPKTQDALAKGAGDKDAIAIATSWGQLGYRWIGPLPHVDSFVHAVLRLEPAPVANADLVELIKAGRNHQPTIGPDSALPAVQAVAKLGAPWWLIVAGVGGGAALLSRA